MNAIDPTDAHDDARAHIQQPTVPLADAVRVLNAAQRAVRAKERAARQARHLQQLAALSRLRRAPQGADDD